MRNLKMWLPVSVVGVCLASFGVAADAGEAQPVDSRVTVNFENPEGYTDASLDDDRRAKSRAFVLERLGAFLTANAGRGLGAGERLVVSVTDIDLAGRIRPGAMLRGENVRLLDDVSWPRITLSYQRYGANGQLMANGENIVVENRAYLMGPATGLSDDVLRHEKAVLRRWVRQTLIADAAD